MTDETTPGVDALAQATDLYDPQFQNGIAWTLWRLALFLGVNTWEEGDGSETVEGDADMEIHNILTAAGVWDAEAGKPVTAPPPAAELVEALEWSGMDAQWLGRLEKAEPPIGHCGESTAEAIARNRIERRFATIHAALSRAKGGTHG